VNGVLGDTIWRTGANAATQLRTDADITIGGAPVPAGTYSLWTHASPRGGYELMPEWETKPANRYLPRKVTECDPPSPSSS